MQSSTLTVQSSSFQTPQWVRDAIFYQIFPDRFARSSRVSKPSNLEPWDSPPTTDGFKGGDLIGVVENLDYLQDLGVTAVYFCPVFQSAANHRYHTHDYYQIDPILGGNGALRTLLDEAHRRNMRVVLDGVFNHASRGFFQFNHILENGAASPYIDWFTVLNWPVHPYGPPNFPPNYECWWNLPALPKFNTRTQAVREFLWDVSAHWIEQGIDGWRLDVPNEIDDDNFWREFRRRVKRVNPDTYIVGEIWGDARRWLAGDQFDAVMNYIFTRAALGFFASGGSGINHEVLQNSGLSPVPHLDVRQFREAVEGLLRLYPWDATLAQLNLLGSHDTPRYLTMACEDDSSFRLATLFQMTFPGAPCIYYGDEIGMLGGHDPDCRRTFPWDANQWNTSLLDHVKRCTSLRATHPVLRHGDFMTLYAADDTFTFARVLGDTMAIIGLNNGGRPSRIDVPMPDTSSLTDVRGVLGDTTFDMANGRIYNWHLPSRTGAVLLGRLTTG